MSLGVSWYWEFGDGETSIEPSPNHVYTMPGVYLVKLTISFSNGTESKYYFTIYVYDYDYDLSVDDNGDQVSLLNASLTDKCYRLPTKRGEGYGVSEYTDNVNPGLDWIWPPSMVRIGKSYDIYKREVALVLDSKTQREYQINDVDVWKDREGNYEGNVIKSEIHHRANTADAGEHVSIRHIEHHESFKSYDRKTMENAPGYNSEGLPIGMEVDNQLFQDEKTITPTTTAKKIPINGDLVFNERVEARNLQLRTIVRGAPFLLTNVIPYFETVDKQQGPSLRVMSEDRYQEQLSSMPLFHISRHYNPILNLATGASASGTYAAAITGPDGRDYSAVRFGAADTGLIDAMPVALSGNFSARLWVKGVTLGSLFGNPRALWVMQNFSAYLVDDAGSYAVLINYNGQIATVQLTITAATWALITFVLDGLTLKTYQDKNLVDTMAIPLQAAHGTAIQCGDDTMDIFDACLVPQVITADAIEYLYDDTIRGGEETLGAF